MAVEKELNDLRGELEDLHRKMLEKDERLKAAETSNNQITFVQLQVDELKRYTAEKDFLIKSSQHSQQQLDDTRIILAHKQAALEKLQREANTSNQMVERLQEELDSMQSQISSLMIIFEGLSKNDSALPKVDCDVTLDHVDRLPGIDDIDDVELESMEIAKQAYVAAVALAKEKQDEESIAAAATARFHLQSFVFKNSDD